MRVWLAAAVSLGPGLRLGVPEGGEASGVGGIHASSTSGGVL